MKVVFGGSFNPPTLAHLAIIQYLSKNFDEVIIIPNANDYQKEELVDYQIRKEMVTLMIQDLSNVFISDLENDRGFKGTFQTLRDLNHPYFACGEDCIEQFSAWINAKTLLEENNFLIFTRKSSLEKMKEKIVSNSFLKPYLGHFRLVKIDFPAISSSEFRKTLDERMVCQEVYQYIKRNQLYKKEV